MEYPLCERCGVSTGRPNHDVHEYQSDCIEALRDRIDDIEARLNREKKS